MKVEQIPDILKSLEDYPEYLQSKDLIKLGIFTDENQAFKARQKRKGPEFFKDYNTKISYAKKMVIKYLKEKLD